MKPVLWFGRGALLLALATVVSPFLPALTIISPFCVPVVATKQCPASLRLLLRRKCLVLTLATPRPPRLAQLIRRTPLALPTPIRNLG